MTPVKFEIERTTVHYHKTISIGLKQGAGPSVLIISETILVDNYSPLLEY